MTTQPQVPGAAAVYLYREQTMDDALHVQSYYVRLKVLTEAGKEFANVKLFGGSKDEGDSIFDLDVTDIEGRTIHSDGTVVPFTGKPYVRTVEKTAGAKYVEKVFTLPDVQVGSILEYRYKMRIGDYWYSSPEWLVQQDLFVRKGYFSWKATDDRVHNILRDQMTLGLAWSQTLPDGATVKSTALPAVLGNGHTFHHFELTVQDVPPVPKEEYMAPLSSFTYRVRFYYALDRSQDEYWKNEGRVWAKEKEHFIGSPGNLEGAVNTLVAPGDSDTVKLQKIYAAVMAMDHTDYSREHGKAEDKAQGLQAVKTAQDIWQRKRGSSDQLTALFIGLARAAGLKAYDMQVTNRDKNLFSPVWLTLSQLNDDVAIVVLDGKEQYFDPGQPECPFGQMAWKHTSTGGLREIAKDGTALANTPEPPYLDSQTQRIADLTMDADGTVHGTLKITWKGTPALLWRQQSLVKDEVEWKHLVRDWVEAKIPAGLNPEITTVDNLNEYEKPLVVNLNVHGPLATLTAKRLILPGQIFEVNSKSPFPQQTRDIAIYFEHGGRTVDAARIKFPPEFHIESVPKESSLTLSNMAGYHSKPEVQGSAILMRRTHDLAVPFFLPKDYSDVRTFYNGMAAADQQSIVLMSDAAASGQPAAGKP